jgi:mRNA-degrading endonuclease RelE of RelBE toxin-antitoxin system
MWTVSTRKAALKSLARAQGKERRQIWEALDEMRADPMSGDVLPLAGERSAFRRRVGRWRLFFDLDPARRFVDVVAIERRTSTTYRKR